MPSALIAASTLGIVLIVLAGVALLFVLGGLIAVRVRNGRRAASYEQNVAAADAALEQARATDRGWSREALERAARAALAESRPGAAWDTLHLVLVDDRPGIEEDRAHFVAVGREGEARVVLARDGESWIAEQVD
jgi:hypothetical protein